MSRNDKRLSWILWHPHQGLWNSALIGAIQRIIPLSPINKRIAKIIILLDSFILFLRALVRRVSLLGLTKVFAKARVPDDISILYFDLGTHKEGAELTLMVDRILPRMCNNFEAYGFEASGESFEEVNKKFADRKNVRLFRKALCHVLPADGKIKLYKDMKGGLGDSLYKPSSSYEEVEAMRLSEFLRENHIVLENKIILLRMNIEGAEYDVIEDLVESQLARYINGYYGMWNDLSKIDMQRDDDFRAFLAKNQIYPFSFNGRDLRWSVRMRCIEYDINTSVQTGMRKLEPETRND